MWLRPLLKFASQLQWTKEKQLSPHPNNCKTSNERVNGPARCPHCGLEAGWRGENLALWMDHRRASLKKRSGQFLKGVERWGGDNRLHPPLRTQHTGRSAERRQRQSLKVFWQALSQHSYYSRVKETNQMRSTRGYSRMRRKETQPEDSGAEHTSEDSLVQIQEANLSCYLPKNAKTERSTL